MAEHNNDYHIVLEPGHVMKGSRGMAAAVTAAIQRNQDGGTLTEQSGEPILRPFTGGSRNSNNHSVSPTFDVGNFSSSPGHHHHNHQQQGDGDLDAAGLRTLMGGGTTVTLDSRANTSANHLYASHIKACEQILFPGVDTLTGVFSLEIVKVLERWYRCHGWPTNFNLVSIPESFRA